MALLLAAGGAIGVLTGTASADTVTGTVSVECNARLFEHVDRTGKHTDVSSGTFATPIIVDVDDDGKITSEDNIYDFDVGSAGTDTSSLDVTCTVTNRSPTKVMVVESIDHLAPPLSNGSFAPGPSCGNGHGETRGPIVGNDGLKLTAFEENLPRDFAKCNDNLLRITLKIGVRDPSGEA